MWKSAGAHSLSKLGETVLDAGEPLSIATRMDHLARSLPIDIIRQGQLRWMCPPLKLPHFMLLPVLILSPLVGLIGAILFILLFPLILVAEWVLINRGLLAKIVDIVLRLCIGESLASIVSVEEYERKMRGRTRTVSQPLPFGSLLLSNCLLYAPSNLVGDRVHCLAIPLADQCNCHCKGRLSWFSQIQASVVYVMNVWLTIFSHLSSGWVYSSC